MRVVSDFERLTAGFSSMIQNRIGDVVHTYTGIPTSSLTNTVLFYFLIMFVVGIGWLVLRPSANDWRR